MFNVFLIFCPSLISINLYNVCLCNLINEVIKILQDEVRKNAKNWKDKIFLEKSMKEKEVMKIERQMDECLCSSAYNVSANNLSREESETEWKSKVNKWNSQIRKERKNLYAVNNKYVEKLKYAKRHGCKVRKKIS